MIPSTILGLLLAVAGLSPGYVYISYASRRRPRVEKSVLIESGEFLLFGVAATGSAAGLVLLLGEWGVFPFAVSLQDWVREGWVYVQDDPWRIVGSALLTFVLALLFALGASAWIHRKADSSVSQFPVWWNVLGERPQQHEVMCAVTTTSGRIIEGFLFAHTTPGDTDPRDIALKPPLWLYQEGIRYKVESVDRIMIGADQIVEIDVRYVPKANQQAD